VNWLVQPTEEQLRTVQNWQPGPLVTSGATPSPLATTGTDASSVPPLLERPAEKGGGFPWLLLAGLGLVAYVMVKK
jgi:hypothetical protein